VNIYKYPHLTPKQKVKSKPIKAPTWLAHIPCNLSKNDGLLPGDSFKSVTIEHNKLLRIDR